MEVFQLYLPASDFLPNIIFLDHYVLGLGMELRIVGQCDGPLFINIDVCFSYQVLDDMFRGVGRVFGDGFSDIVQGCVSRNTLQFIEKS